MGTVGHPLTCGEPCTEAWQQGLRDIGQTMGFRVWGNIVTTMLFFKITVTTITAAMLTSSILIVMRQGCYSTAPQVLQGVSRE